MSCHEHESTIRVNRKQKVVVWPWPGQDMKGPINLSWNRIQKSKNSGIYPILYTYTYNTRFNWRTLYRTFSEFNNNNSKSCMRIRCMQRVSNEWKWKHHMLSHYTKGSNRFNGVGTAPWSPSETHSLPVYEFNDAVFVAMSYQLFISVSLWELRTKSTIYWSVITRDPFFGSENF